MSQSFLNHSQLDKLGLQRYIKEEKNKSLSSLEPKPILLCQTNNVYLIYFSFTSYSALEGYFICLCVTSDKMGDTFYLLSKYEQYEDKFYLNSIKNVNHKIYLYIFNTEMQTLSYFNHSQQSMKREPILTLKTRFEVTN